MAGPKILDLQLYWKKISRQAASALKNSEFKLKLFVLIHIFINLRDVDSGALTIFAYCEILFHS